MDQANEHELNYDEQDNRLLGETDDAGVNSEDWLTDALDSAAVDQCEEENDSPAVLAMEAVILKAHRALLAKHKKGGKRKIRNEFVLNPKPTVSVEPSAEARSKPPQRGKCDRSGKRWSIENTSLLIDMLEERPCLWDTACKDYQSRDKRGKALEDMQDVIGIPPNDIKLKISSLRGQLGRELAKVSKTKSGQSADDRYKSTWVFWERLQFLRPVMQPGKSKDTMQFSSESSPESLETMADLEDASSASTPLSQKSNRSSLEAKKHELMTTCINVLKEPALNSKEEDHFALYIGQKLNDFDPKTRAVAEKRITDIIFDLEINSFNQYPQMSHASQGNFSNHAYTNAMGLQQNTGEYLSMLQ